jgi:pimeloyl-ACP methyl ester carboxylesterase
MELIDLPDGRVLEVHAGGVAGGPTVVLFNGTPSAPVPYAPLDALVVEKGWQLVTWARPGYGRSTRRPGRTVADVVEDLRAVADAVGFGEFVTLGTSGGGPHALACAALAPNRCRAAATIGSPAPYHADGLDWLAGMADENRDEFGVAAEGTESLTAFLEAAAAGLADMTRDDLITGLGGLVDEVDKRALDGPLGGWMHASLRAAVAGGIAGWRDDDLAFVRDWGFDLSAITVPVTVWQGGADRMVPAAHGAWLASHIPGVHAHLLPEHGHVSLATDGLRRVLTELVAA